MSTISVKDGSTIYYNRGPAAVRSPADRMFGA